MRNYPLHDGYSVVEEYVIPDHLKPLINSAFLREFGKIVLGKTANEVLDFLPRFMMVDGPKVVYYDDDGLVVEWYYDNVIFTFAYSKDAFESAYCLQQIQVKDVNN